MTEKHLLLTDNELENNFKTCSLSPVLFTHEAHLRLAYIQLKKHDKDTAIENMCTQLDQFDRLCGTGTKFDKELTEISVGILSEFMDEYNPKDFRDLICSCPILKDDFKSLVLQKMHADPLKNLSKEGMKRSILYS